MYCLVKKLDPKFKIGDIVIISKTFLQKAVFQIDLKKFLLLQKLITKILFRWHILLLILKVKKLLERFTKNNCKKKLKNSLGLKK